MRVEASNVLDTNASIKRAFTGSIIGYFRRLGPNRWDDYDLVRDDLGPIDVLPGVRVQLASSGPELRMRAKGKVVLVRWMPPSDLVAARPELRGPALREYFVEEYCGSSRDDAGIGASAVIARKLDD